MWRSWTEGPFRGPRPAIRKPGKPFFKHQDSWVESGLMAGTLSSTQHAFGTPGKTAGWDGHAWDGVVHDDPSVQVPPAKHRALPFLRHKWFWLVVAGQALVLATAYLAAAADSPSLAWLTLPGYILFMAGSVLIVDRHVKWADLLQFRTVLAWGLASGFVAFVIARIIEGGVEPRLVPFSVELWLAGPVEETSKLLVPVLLLAFGGMVFKDPRAGLLLVLTSGAVFGVAEGVYYSTNASQWGILSEAITRPVSEMGHPYMTGMAASVIWLAAWRSRRLVTRAGLLAWVAAMALHSVHDGLGSFTKDQQNITSFTSVNADFWKASVGGAVFAFIWVVLMYLLTRHTARELVPPDRVAGNPGHWRPQMKSWGVR